VIYFIETQGMVKIGHSVDPQKRFTMLATGCPSRCTLIGVAEGGRAEERALHKQFSDLHSHGEWFRFERPINEYLRAHAVPIDRLSHDRKPPKNAPPKWNEISACAKACGAGDWAMRKWLERCEIPAGWKLKIIEHTRGKIALGDMVITPKEERAA
jgi:hypothetical protein